MPRLTGELFQNSEPDSEGILNLNSDLNEEEQSGNNYRCADGSMDFYYALEHIAEVFRYPLTYVWSR